MGKADAHKLVISGPDRNRSRVAVIIHGKTSRLRGLCHRLREQFEPDFQLQFYLTAHPGHGEELAHQAVLSGQFQLIAIGGDGTVSDVVNGMIRASEALDEDRCCQLRLGIIAKGSGNDFIRNMNRPNTLQALYEDVRHDNHQVVDIGQLQFVRADEISASRYFLNIADVGLGGVVAHRISRLPRWIPSLIKYQFSILRTLLQYKHQAVTIEGKEMVRTGKILALILANGKYFGKGLGIAPFANVQDGKILAVWIGNVSIMEYLRYLPKIRKCQPIHHPELHYFHCETLHITHLDQPLPIDLDGEFIGYTPATIDVFPHHIRVFGTLTDPRRQK